MKPGQPSQTAVLVCAARAIAHSAGVVRGFSDPTALEPLPEPARAMLEAHRAGSPKTLRARFRYEFMVARAAMMAVRTVVIDEAVRDAGAPQVVILGAGFDGRAWRMPELRSATVHEVDHPDTQRADGIQPPRGPQKRSTSGVSGWVSSCVREMLRNPKYVGEWRFGVREWGRDPDTERRVVRKFRDASNAGDRERLVEQVFPKLAIVDRRFWDRVLARLGEHLGRYKRREVSDRKSSYLLSGLLRCASCGSRMQIYGGAVPRYRCSANTKRGVCANALSVREGELRQGIVSAIARRMSAPSSLALMKHRVADHLRRQVEERSAKLASAKREPAWARLRELLRRLLKDGAITLEPRAKERAYVAQAVLWPLALLDKTPTPGGKGRAYDNRSCAGRI